MYHWETKANSNSATMPDQAPKCCFRRTLRALEPSGSLAVSQANSNYNGWQLLTEVVNDNVNPAIQTNYAYGKRSVFNAEYSQVMPVNAGTNVGFTGQRVEYFDNNGLELGYYKNRWYSPGMGRFLSHDQLGYIDSMCLYLYVKNMPIDLIDELGFLSNSGRVSDCISNCQKACNEEYGWYNPQRYACSGYCNNACTNTPDLYERLSNWVEPACNKIKQIYNNPVTGCVCAALQIADIMDPGQVYSKLDEGCSLLTAANAICDNKDNLTVLGSLKATALSVFAIADYAVENMPAGPFWDTAIGLAQNTIDTGNPIGPQFQCANNLSCGSIHDQIKMFSKLLIQSNREIGDYLYGDAE